MTVLVTTSNETRGRRSRLSNRLLLFTLLLVTSCSDKTMSLFFDIPPASQQEASGEAAPTRSGNMAGTSGPEGAGATSGMVAAEAERPEIEGIFDWEEASGMLPQDMMGGVDWVAALEQGLIRPRPGPAKATASPKFNLDFFLPGPDTAFDAYFPHSAHTPILECKNCHTTIFRYRNNNITMTDLYEGKYCATCHGKVAFGLEACSRCHRDM